MRLYELLYAYRDKNEVEWNIDKYREWMGCGVQLHKATGKPIMDNKTGKPKYIKYPSHAHAIERTTREPIKEFKGTELEFKVIPITASACGRGRPAIEKVRFEFVWQKKSTNQKILAWIEQSAEFKKIYERLKKYNVSDIVIINYSRIIGQKKLNELLYQWDLRQLPNSKDKILNPEKYCNKVLADIGKKLESEK